MPKGYIVKAEYHDGTEIELLVPPFKVKAEAEALAKQWRASDLCRDAWTVPVELCDFAAMGQPDAP